MRQNLWNLAAHKFVKITQVQLKFENSLFYWSAVHRSSHINMLSSAMEMRNVPRKPLSVTVLGFGLATNHIVSEAKMILDTNICVLHGLCDESIKTWPWLSNSDCLILNMSENWQSYCSKFMDFVNNGGKLVFLPNDISEMNLYESGCRVLDEFTWVSTENGVVMKELYTMGINHLAFGKVSGKCIEFGISRNCRNGGIAVLGRFRDVLPESCSMNSEPTNREPSRALQTIFKAVDVPVKSLAERSLSNAYLFAQSLNDMKNWLRVIQSSKLSSYQVQCIPFGTSATDVKASIDCLPIIYSSNGITPCNEFDVESYFSELGSSRFGRVLLYCNTIPTTSRVIDSLMVHSPTKHGLAIVARCQTTGRGRNGNQWISPLGSLAISFHYHVFLHEQIFKNLGCLQHVVGLAVILAVKTIHGYEDFDLKLKWPNDVYYGKNVKIGGILVENSVMGNSLHANIGIGINLDNQNPTVSINHLLVLAGLKEISFERMCGRILDQFSSLLLRFDEKGFDDFHNTYRRYWIHSNQEVTLLCGSKAVVQGIDQNGYLLVELKSGLLVSVHPNGNSFDMFNNLITQKF